MPSLPICILGMVAHPGLEPGEIRFLRPALYHFASGPHLVGKVGLEPTGGLSTVSF